MDDEFAQFIQGGLHVSSEGHEIQLWGVRESGDVDVKGISIHWPDRWDSFNPTDDAPGFNRINCAYEVAQRADIPLIWVGESKADWRELDGAAEVGEISRASGGGYSASVAMAPLSELEEELQEIMGTDLAPGTTDKEINRAITPVQNWVRNNMPIEFAVIDIDILVGDGSGNPRGMVEIKRSSWDPEDDWWPFYEDRRNFYLLADAAEKSDTEPVLIQHEMGQVDDETVVGFYQDISKNDHSGSIPFPPSEAKSRRWLNYDDEYIQAAAARERLKSL